MGVGGDGETTIYERRTASTDDPPTSASTDAVDESLKTRAMDEAPVGITVADARKPDMPLVYANAAFERITGYPPEYAVGRNCRFLQGEETRDEPVAEMRRAIEEGRTTTVELRNYRRDGELFWNEVTLAPLRDGAGEIAYFVGFQQDVTRRKRAERAAEHRAARIEREREAQKRLLERLNGVVADVTEAVTRADSRADLERRVAETVRGAYAGAWIGTYDPSAEAIVPRESVGETGGIGVDDALPIGGCDDSEAPTGHGTAAITGATITAVADACADQYVHIESVDGDGGDRVSAVAAVPLHYGDVTYGIVAVYADATPFHNYERAVLTALGRSIATGINALESHRTLQSESAVEVRFETRDHPLVAFADALGCRLRYAGSLADRERSTMLFEIGREDTGSPVDAAAVRDAAEITPSIEVHSVLAESADSPVVELSVADSRFRDLLEEHGAELRALGVDAASATSTVEVGREAMAQSLADAVMERFADAELVGYQRRTQRNETRREFVAELQSELTERQQAALTRAYTAGYFEWPHEATGDEIAESMGIGRSTFHQHLRSAQRKLVGAVVDDDVLRSREIDGHGSN
ncbi:PAS domain S-box protein [Halobellus rubicundus]|uniref:PAS domain S-box protein n=1 Tax=Halobellus rubicundus TaxID=2996466 RepID=A0ABD5MEV2_9EURY